MELLIIIWRKLKKCLCEIFRFIKLIVCLSVKYFWVLIASMVVFFALGYVATLPILTKYRVEGVVTFYADEVTVEKTGPADAGEGSSVDEKAEPAPKSRLHRVAAFLGEAGVAVLVTLVLTDYEIGRASCRERV